MKSPDVFIKPPSSDNGPTKCEPTFRFAGVEIWMKARRKETVGRWSLMEYLAPAHFTGPAPHYHKTMEEGFYVLDGVATFSFNGIESLAGTGSFVHIAPYTVHTFRNATDQPLRLLILMTPGGFEDYFDELQFLLEKEPVWPPKDMSQLHQLLEKYDTYYAG